MTVMVSKKWDDKLQDSLEHVLLLRLLPLPPRTSARSVYYSYLYSYHHQQEQEEENHLGQ